MQGLNAYVPFMRLLFASFIFCTLTLVAVLPLFAAESLRTQEINTCLAGEIVTWGDGRDRPAGTSLLKITYNPGSSPDWISTEQVVGMITKAADAWSQCDVPIQMVAWNNSLAKQHDIVVVKWDEKGSMGNFGLTNFKSRTLSIGPNAFNLLKQKIQNTMPVKLCRW